MKNFQKGEYDITYHAQNNEHKENSNFSDNNYHGIYYDFKYIYKQSYWLYSYT